MATTTDNDSTRHRQHFGEDARRIAESLRVTTTGSPLVPLRTLVLLGVAGACVSVAVFPANLIGVVVLVLIAFDAGRRR